MKFLILFATLISYVVASGHYGHHIPARVDIAPGGVETIYTQKVIPQVYTTSYKTPITAPVIAKYPIIGKTLHTSVEHYPVVTHHGGYAHGGYGGHGAY